MRKLLLFITLFMTFSAISKAQKTEIRAVWLTTIGGIDWPHSYAQSAPSIARQQQEFCDILDQLAKANINTVLLQTRVRGTTIFPSMYEPWDGCLSGKPGMSPGYDALEFAIKECHKRGMKLHAWVVSIPLGLWNGAGCRNLRNSQPKLVKKIGDHGFMNPEASGVSNYLASFCRDIVSRYDVDGIHLDYIRYPDEWKKIKDKNVARDNITRIVRAVHREVKALKPWVMLSCSPVGKYADTMRSWSHGWNARDVVCQDVALWMREGLMDAIFPMMYFRDKNFYPFAIDWQERSNGRIVAPGLGTYFLHPREGNWQLRDITRELHVLRQYGMGNCQFRSKFFTDNTKGIYTYYKEGFATGPSLQPAMTWYGVPKPHAPQSLTVSQNGEGAVVLKWEKVDGMTYNVYGSSVNPVCTDSAECLLAGALDADYVVIPKNGSLTYFAVTATDRYGNESMAVQSVPEQIGSASSVRVGRGSLYVKDGKVDLSKADVANGNLVEVKSVMGNVVCKRVVSGKKINVANLPTGNYYLYVVNKKNYRHLLGNMSIPIE